MTARNNVAERPRWTTHAERVEGSHGDGDMFRERLTPVAVLRRSGSQLATDGTVACNIGFEVVYTDGEGIALESDELPQSWLAFEDRDAAKTFARALLAAVEDWDRLEADCMSTGTASAVERNAASGERLSA